MTLVVADLAQVILSALGSPTDAHGVPIPVTSQMTDYAKAVIDTIKGGTFAHALVTATGANGAPITLGAAAGGVITGFSSATWEGDLSSGFAGATSLHSNAVASVAYLMTGTVVFTPGQITGSCTSTPTSAGILQNGAGAGGHIVGLSGSAWAAAVGSPGPLAAPVYTAIATYVMANAVCAYATGKVTGTFAIGGGPLIAGIGINGTFS